MDQVNACKEHNTYKKYNNVMLKNRRSEKQHIHNDTITYKCIFVMVKITMKMLWTLVEFGEFFEVKSLMPLGLSFITCEMRVLDYKEKHFHDIWISLNEHYIWLYLERCLNLSQPVQDFMKHSSFLSTGTALPKKENVFRIFKTLGLCCLFPLLE